MQDDHEALRARVDRLEGANRRLAFLAFSFAAVFFLGVVRRPAVEAQRARSFEVVDQDGKVRAALRLQDGVPQLVLLDEAGGERATILHDAEQTGFFLRDAQGTVRLGAAQFAHGGGGYALHGEGSKGAAVLYLKGGKGALSFYDEEGGVIDRVPSKE